MDYEKGSEELYQIAIDAWKKVESGFYPEINEGVKLYNIKTKIESGETQTGFWELFDFLLEDLFAMSVKPYEEGEKRAFEILKEIDDQAEVEKHVERYLSSKDSPAKTVVKRGMKYLR